MTTANENVEFDDCIIPAEVLAAAANDPWANAPLHKLIARDMGMDEETAAQFYAMVGKDY